MTKTRSAVKLALTVCAREIGEGNNINDVIDKKCRACPYNGGGCDDMARDSLEYIMELEKKVKELAGDEGVQQPGETVPELPELSGDGCSV